MSLQTWLRERTERHPHLAVLLLLVCTAVPLLLVIDAPTHGDVQLYERVCKDLAGGLMPYRDRELEYPPYAILLFFVPWVFSHAGFQLAFAAAVAVADGALKSLFIFEAGNKVVQQRRLFQLALYCFAVPFISYFYLQRYDIFPAALTVAAVCLFARDWCGWAGAILAFAAGVKMYPALLGPVLWLLAIQRGRGVRFALGSGLALLPLAVLSFFLPWWRFLAFHGERGLQCESLYASAIWLAHLGGFADARWSFVKAWTEVTGPVALVVLPWAKLLMAGATFGSVGFASWVAWRVKFPRDGGAADESGRRDSAPVVVNQTSRLTPHPSPLPVEGRGRSASDPWPLPVLCRLCLVPLLAFVAFNIVLSPQYMIWLLPLAALGILDGGKWPMVLIAVCTAVTPIFYPSPEYVTGLNLFQTLVLLGRNVSLIVVWVVLIREFWGMAREPKDGRPHPGPLPQEREQPAPALTPPHVRHSRS